MAKIVPRGRGQGVVVDLNAYAPAKTVGRVVSGFTMGGIRDGWMVFYEETDQVPGPEIDGDLCVVMTTDDRCYLRFTHPTKTPGRFDLVSVTGPTMFDVELRWGAKVNMIVPHQLSQQERDVIAA